MLNCRAPRRSLRQGAAAAREGSWQAAVIDSKANIRSHFAPIGPVFVMGPNNFPFAFNGVAGGDLTAAIAAGCPVIAKGHPLHPGTTRLLAECAAEALKQADLPAATVQMLYHISNEDGLRMVADSRLGATSFTGSRAGGLKLRAAAETAGKPIYLEMSSLNPVILLPGAIAERGDKLATEIVDSALAGTGQFCTSPNLILAIDSPETDKLTEELSVATGTAAFRCTLLLRRLGGPRSQCASFAAGRRGNPDRSGASGRRRISLPQHAASRHCGAFSGASWASPARGLWQRHDARHRANFGRVAATRQLARRQSHGLHLHEHNWQRRRAVRAASSRTSCQRSAAF